MSYPRKSSGQNLDATKALENKVEDVTVSLTAQMQSLQIRLEAISDARMLGVEKSKDTHSISIKQKPRPRPCSIVPFRRDDKFVYRGALADIKERCAQPAARVALVGLGGVG